MKTSNWKFEGYENQLRIQVRNAILSLEYSVESDDYTVFECVKDEDGEFSTTQFLIKTDSFDIATAFLSGFDWAGRLL